METPPQTIIARIVRRTTEAQGLPERVEDVQALLTVGRMLRRSLDEATR